MCENRKDGIPFWVCKHGSDAESLDDCYLTDEEMALKSAMSHRESDSDTPLNRPGRGRPISG